MHARLLMLASLLALAVGACTWPPRPSIPNVPAQAGQPVTQGSDATARTADQTLGTAGRTLDGVGRSAGGLTGGMPPVGVGGGGLLR